MTWKEFSSLDPAARIRVYEFTYGDKTVLKISGTIERFKKWVVDHGIRLDRLREVAVERTSREQYRHMPEPIEAKEIEKLIRRLFELRAQKVRTWSLPGLPIFSDEDPRNVAEEFLDLFRKYAPLVLGWLDPVTRTHVPGIGFLIWGDNEVDPIDAALLLGFFENGQSLADFCILLNDPENQDDDCLDRVQKRIAALKSNLPII